MLYLVYHHPKSPELPFSYCHWHVGSPKDDIRELVSGSEPMECLEVRADGDELNWLLASFSNIPSCKARVQTWRGEFARFIAEHFPYIKC